MALSEKFSWYLFKFFKRICNIFQVLCVCLNAFRGYKLWALADSHGNSGNLSCCYLLRLLNEPSCWRENVHILDSTRTWRRAISSSRAADLRAIPTPKRQLSERSSVLTTQHPGGRHWSLVGTLLLFPHIREIHSHLRNSSHNTLYAQVQICIWYKYT